MPSPSMQPYTERISIFPTTSSLRGTVIYIHGGGLIFGSRNDLPDPYIAAFNDAGFTIVALDYPFAPRCRTEAILGALEETISSLHDNGGLRGDRLILFGRSAGAYLALNLQARAIMRGEHLADRLISLYGYTDMQDKDFHRPSSWYQAFGYVDPLPDQPDADDFTTRFSLYVGLRQRGTWPETVLDATTTPIPDDVLRRLPPTFLAASAYDPDVPFRCSKHLATVIPQSSFYRVYDATDHDFDRDPASPHGLPMYQEIINWLQTD
ncbi:MAG: alpha/beta hydrolase [Thermomicrobiales bacterium]|nr:alpha/beta hydrolase [Thermomicrobiales bacterium]